MARREYHDGIVRRNDDPERRGRLQIEVPTIVVGAVLPWAEPLFHFTDDASSAGSFWIPNVGSQVEVEIDSENDAESRGFNPKWRCSVYPTGRVPREFQENYPKRRGWKTQAGHLFYFDDSEGQRTFLYQHPSGAEVRVDNVGQIFVKPPAGQGVFVGTNATQAMVRGNVLSDFLIFDLMPWLSNHTHEGPAGPSDGASPLPPLVPTDLLSTYNRVE